MQGLTGGDLHVPLLFFVRRKPMDDEAVAAVPTLSSIKPNYTKRVLRGDDTRAFDGCLGAGLSQDEYSFTESLEGMLEDINSLRIGDVGYIDGILSKEECQSLCDCVDGSPDLSFWSSAGRGDVDARLFRDADTIEMVSEGIAAKLWFRVGEVLRHKEVLIGETEHGDSGLSDRRFQRGLQGTWIADGINSNLLLAKYPSNGAFSPHTDGSAVESFNRRSFYSIIIFLNSIPEEEGGGTRFYRDDVLSQLERGGVGSSGWTGASTHLLGTVEAKEGRLLVFDQSIVHEGVAPHAPYCKYIMRTDIMFSRQHAECDSCKDREAYALFMQAEHLAEAGDTDGSIRLFQHALRLSRPLGQMLGHA